MSERWPPLLLDHRAIFSARREISDEYGGTRDEWVPQFNEWAEVKYLRGGERIMEARLASRNPVIVSIRNSKRARQITSEWQVELRSRSGVTKVYAIKEDPRPEGLDGFLSMLCEG